MGPPLFTVSPAAPLARSSEGKGRHRCGPREGDRPHGMRRGGRSGHGRRQPEPGAAQTLRRPHRVGSSFPIVRPLGDLADVTCVPTAVRGVTPTNAPDGARHRGAGRPRVRARCSRSPSRCAGRRPWASAAPTGRSPPRPRTARRRDRGDARRRRALDKRWLPRPRGELVRLELPSWSPVASRRPCSRLPGLQRRPGPRREVRSCSRRRTVRRLPHPPPARVRRAARARHAGVGHH